MIRDSALISAAIIVAAFIVGRAIEAAAKHVGDRIDNNSRLLDRVGTKLDSLWSPLKSISNKLWNKTG